MEKIFLEKEEDMISSASSLSEVHSEEDDVYDKDSTSEISDYEEDARWQAKQIEKEHRYLINEYNIQIPHKQNWIASWYEKNNNYAAWPSRGGYIYQLNVYGYYKKKKRAGGYGVIFRDPGGKPINASVHSSKGGSYLYYLLKGLRRGLKLAIAYGRLDAGVRVRCNSQRLVRIINSVFSSPRSYHLCGRRPPEYQRKKICKKCTKPLFYDMKSREFKRLYRIIKDVTKMSKGFKFNGREYDSLFNIMRMDRSGNKAAYYLAKHFKNKSGMKPQEFPSGLREIIWKDAYEGLMAYSETSWMMQFNQKPR